MARYGRSYLNQKHTLFSNGALLLYPTGPDSITGTVANVTTAAPAGTWASVTSVFNNFEGLTPGTTVTTSNSGGASGTAFDVVGVNGTLAAATAAAHGGVCLSLQSTSAANTFVQYTSAGPFGAQTNIYFRFYARTAANPGTAVRLFNATTSGGSLFSVFLNTTGKMSATYSSAGTSFVTFTNAVPLGQWFRVEGFCIVSATVGQVSASMFTSGMDNAISDETHTSAATLNVGTLSGTTSYSFGDSSAITMTSAIDFDDLGLSNGGPIGPVVNPVISTGVGSVSLASGSTVNVSPSRTTTAGSTLAIFCTDNGSRSVSGVSDSVNGSWTQGTNVTSGTVTGYWYYFQNAASVNSGTTITLTGAGTSTGVVTWHLAEVTGVATAGGIDINVTATGTSTSPSVATGTMAASNEIVLAGIVSGSGSGAAVWSDVTPLYEIEGTGGNEWGATAWWNPATTTSFTPAATFTSATWGMAVMSFEPTGGSPVSITGTDADNGVAAPAGSVTVSLTGTVANVTAAAPAGVPSISLSGTVANITEAAPSGMLSAGASLTGAVASVSVAAPAGTSKDSLAGTVANVTAGAPAGTLSAGASLTGTVANITAGAPAGAVSTGFTATGSAPNITVGAPAGTLSAGASLTGTVANIAVGAPAGTAVIGTVVVGGVANVAVAAIAPGTISTGFTATGSAPTITVAAPAGTPSGKITGTTANVAVAAPSGSVSTGFGAASTPNVSVAAFGPSLVSTGFKASATPNVIVAAPAGVPQVSLAGTVENISTASPAGTFVVGIHGTAANISVAAYAPSLITTGFTSGSQANVAVSAPSGVPRVSFTPASVPTVTTATYAPSEHVTYSNLNANVTVGAPGGTVSVPIHITAGATPTITIAAPSGTAVGGETFHGTAANVAVGAPAGHVSAGTSLVGGSANITAGAPAMAAEHVTFSVSPANVSVSAPAGTVMAAMIGHAANVTVAAFGTQSRVTVPGGTPNITVAAHGTAWVPSSVSIAWDLYVNTTVSLGIAFNIGLPYQTSLRKLVPDPWISPYDARIKLVEVPTIPSQGGV